MLTGCSREETEGKKAWQEFVEKEYREKVTSYHHARRVDPHSSPERYEFRIIDRAGLKRDVIAAVAMIPGTKRSVVSLLDVTGQKVAEEALRRSESRYRGLFETLPDGFVSMDLDGRIIECNPAFQAMVGYCKEELPGMPYHHLSPEKWHALDDEIIREQVLKKGYSDVYEKEDVRNDGSIFPVEIRMRLIKDQDGNPSEIWAFVRDISEHKKMEQSLRESEEKFRLLFEKSADPALLLGKDGFIDCNEAALVIMGRSEKGRLLGLNPIDISPERQPDGSPSAESAKKHARIALKEGFDRFDWVHRTFSNEELWVDVSLTDCSHPGKTDDLHCLEGYHRT